MSFLYIIPLFLLYFNVETFNGRKTLYILKSSKIKQCSKGHIAALQPENVIRIYNVDIGRYCIIFKGKEQSFFSNNFIVLNHIQICFITIYDGCLT